MAALPLNDCLQFSMIALDLRCSSSGSRIDGRAGAVVPSFQFSDEYAPFHTKVINVSVRDATHVLDGLLYQQSDLGIEEHYTDTTGFTDHVFALCHLLGFRFAPRIRDLADKRLYVLAKLANGHPSAH